MGRSEKEESGINGEFHTAWRVVTLYTDCCQIVIFQCFDTVGNSNGNRRVINVPLITNGSLAEQTEKTSEGKPANQGLSEFKTLKGGCHPLYLLI